MFFISLPFCTVCFFIPLSFHTLCFCYSSAFLYCMFFIPLPFCTVCFFIPLPFCTVCFFIPRPFCSVCFFLRSLLLVFHCVSFYLIDISVCGFHLITLPFPTKSLFTVQGRVEDPFQNTDPYSNQGSNCPLI